MANLTYEQFKAQIENRIKNFLPEEFADYSMKFQIITKSGYEYEALLITPPSGSNVTPALNITEAFKKYEEGKSMEVILYNLADIRMNTSLPSFDQREVFDFEKIKSKIFPRIVNTATNQKFLLNKPHKEIEDLSIMYDLRIAFNENEMSAALISNDMMKIWNKSVEEIHSIAMSNLEELPFVLNNLESILSGSEETVEIEDINLADYDVPFFVLTNNQKHKGAVMAISNAIMDRITKKFGNVYILPSSIDEVIIVPQTMTGNLDIADLKRMVCDVNSSEVQPEDQLSDHIYEYDYEKHSFSMVM